MSDGVTECDDAANTNPLDGCHNCVVLDGWYCYGGSSTGPDTCYEEVGDGMDYGSFACDNYDNGTFDGCLNGAVIDGYYCYGGTYLNGGDTCYEICGDHKNPSQMDGNANDCDDNNNANGDGCSTDCAIEEGYYCYGGDSSNPDVCFEECGDGLLKGYYACDDGNLIDGDG
jgi:cysteine-rich repeat protein